jgi:hypothetical protein
VLFDQPGATVAALLQWGLGGLEAGLGTYLVGRLDGARSLARLLALQLFHQLEVGQAGEAEGGLFWILQST